LELWGKVRLPAHAGWSELFSLGSSLFFSCSSIWSALPPARWGNSVWMLPSVPEIGSGIHLLPCFGWLVCRSASSLSLYASPNLLGAHGSSRWLVCPPGPSSAFAALWHITESLVLRIQFLATPLTVQQWEISCMSHLIPQGRFSAPPPPMSVLDYSSLFMAFSFAGGVQSVQSLS
jgi:hypothetical protein